VQAQERAIVGCVGLLAIAFSLPGCLPFPHVERRASETGGVLVRDGRPVANAQVKRVLGKSGGPDSCAASGEATTTDAAGSFSFPSSQRFEAVVPLIGDPIAPVTICIDVGQGLTDAWAASFLGARPPETLALVCEVSDTIVGEQRRGAPTTVVNQVVCNPVR